MRTADQVWAKVARGSADECWPWEGWRRAKGYGALSFNGRPMRAHRVVWILTNGPIADGFFVCHRCDNPPCCNPAHLFLGTNGDNVADKVAKGRQKKQRDPWVCALEQHGRRWRFKVYGVGRLGKWYSFPTREAAEAAALQLGFLRHPIHTPAMKKETTEK